MKPLLKPVRPPFASDSIERILSRYYKQLVEWSRILARGDESAAEETVQDLCLHLTVAQPDLSGVQNLDNYLFMCLRNMYASNLARVSRERLRIIQVEDYDAVGMAVEHRGMDAVDVQNELLQICDYAAARKYSSKSASQFILHFFFGYRRSDVALLARLPVAAIYNGLKDIRGELREHLTDGRKIRLLAPSVKRPRELLRTPIASDLLLQELRSTLLDSDPTKCASETELAQGYTQAASSPVHSQELAHLAGCERCLKIVERVLQLDDRDGPLDGVDIDHAPKEKDKKSFDAAMQRVRRRREQLLERRPALLAIAVDGRVVAFHAVESVHNSLSSRVESAATVRFIEVFNEFGDRLAHIPLEAESAAAPATTLSQQLLLSDDRRLRLDVHFDGLGIHAEVDYVDPALSFGADSQKPNRTSETHPSWWARLRNWFRIDSAPWAAPAFASLLVATIAAVAGYKYTHPGVHDVLSRAQAAVQAPSSDEALHQMLRVEEVSGPEKGSILGSVDIWRKRDRQVVRRLYNAQQQLLATSIESADGSTAVRMEKDAAPAPGDRQLIASGVWRSDVSTEAFAGAAEASRNLSGVELSQSGEGNGVLTRTLVLDRNYGVRAERVRFKAEQGVYEVRLVQTFLRRVPTREVPPSTFPEPQQTPMHGTQSTRGLLEEPGTSPADDANGANVEVSVLFALFQQGADTGEPLDVHPAPAGRVRVSGTVENAQILAAIRERIAALPSAGRVDFQVYSAAQAATATHHGKELRQELIADNSDAPAAGLVRDALLARGLKGTALQNAEQEFTASVLMHAQTALQHAYALDRLGGVLRHAGASSLSPEARVQWAKMVEKHSAAALAELKVLRLQLDSIAPSATGAYTMDADGIADAADFARVASELRAKAQSVNEKIVEMFAGSAAKLGAVQVRDSINRVQAALPVGDAGRMQSFALHLAGQTELGESHPR